MKITSLEIQGLKLIELKFFRDERGFFAERYNQKAFAEAGLNIPFVQDNLSRSTTGVVRGLHYQTGPTQGKLVGAVRGRIWDVAVDIRKDSPTFGKHYGVELNEDNGLMLWIPPGFAHGFCVLGEAPADVLYKVDNFYSATGDGGISWNDPELGIQWPLEGRAPVVSAKDQGLPSFEKYRKNPKF